MSPVPAHAVLARARQAVGEVRDPELPMLTLEDLGVLREVQVDVDGRVLVGLTPTYTGCPAMATMRADVRLALRRAGFDDVEIRTVLHPPWTTDAISPRGRAALAEHGIAPPGPVGHRAGPAPLTLGPRPPVPCPRCGSARTTETSRFGSTACTAMRRCDSCGEPFGQVKEL